MSDLLCNLADRQKWMDSLRRGKLWSLTSWNIPRNHQCLRSRNPSSGNQWITLRTICAARCFDFCRWLRPYRRQWWRSSAPRNLEYRIEAWSHSQRNTNRHALEGWNSQWTLKHLAHLVALSSSLAGSGTFEWILRLTHRTTSCVYNECHCFSYDSIGPLSHCFSCTLRSGTCTLLSIDKRAHGHVSIIWICILREMAARRRHS